MNQQHFDKLVREKLATLEAEQDANGWDMFAQKLDAAENVSGSAVSIATFDQIFQDKLGDISITNSGDSWDIFEQKLAGEEAGTPVIDEAVLDEVVYNKLYNYQVPYEAATWKMLLARLHAETWRRTEIGVYKVAELAILLLLFLFGQQFITEQSLQSLPISIVKEQVIAQQDNESKEADKIIGLTETAQVVTSNKSKKGSEGQVENIPTTVVTQQKKSPVNSPVNPVDVSTDFNHKSDGVVVEKENDLSITEQEEVTPVIEKVNTPVIDKTENVLASIDAEIPTLNNDEVEELTKVNILTPAKKDTWRVGMFGTGMIDHVATPRDQVFKIDGYDRYSLGYGGGFSVGKQLLNNKWEIETGLIYIAKRYPQQVVLHIFNGNVKDGYGVTWVSDIEMNIVNIPLNLRYNIIDNNKWKVYGLGGASLQLLLQANYDSDVESLQFSAAPPSGESKSSRASESDSELYKRKRFNNGFLVDGDFKNNRYYSYNVGIGLERFVSPRWSVFAQPTYQHTIKAFNNDGIGPNRDRINTMLILLGAKVGL